MSNFVQLPFAQYYKSALNLIYHICKVTSFYRFVIWICIFFLLTGGEKEPISLRNFHLLGCYINVFYSALWCKCQQQQQTAGSVAIRYKWIDLTNRPLGFGFVLTLPLPPPVYPWLLFCCWFWKPRLVHTSLYDSLIRLEENATLFQWFSTPLLVWV